MAIIVLVGTLRIIKVYSIKWLIMHININLFGCYIINTKHMCIYIMDIKINVISILDFFDMDC